MNPQPDIAFRVDAATWIGSGHVIRCLTLASELKRLGATCRFICRDFEGNLADHIAAQGFRVDLLPAYDDPLGTSARDESAFLGVTSERDARETRALLGGQVDWIVVDHYGIDTEWETAMRPSAKRIAVIDDLANRQHDCDLLLDQTLGRSKTSYKGFVPDSCTLLIGAEFALLRPEFRGKGRPRTESRQASHALISMGGGDQHNITIAALKTLRETEQCRDHRVTVILGPLAQNHAEVTAFAAKDRAIDVRSGVTNMAEFLTEVDYAIGAVGMSALERAVMGVPSVLVTLAANQKAIAHALNDLGAAIAGGEFGTKTFEQDLSDAIVEMTKPETQARVSRRALRVSHGFGAAMAAANLAAQDITLDFATVEDAADIYDWRYADGAEKHYKSGNKPSFDDHVDWLNGALTKADEILLMASAGGQKSVHVRLTKSDNAQNIGLVGICTAPHARGKGFGLGSLKSTANMAKLIGIETLVAEIKADNTASRRLFESAGYAKTDHVDGFDVYHLTIS